MASTRELVHALNSPCTRARATVAAGHSPAAAAERFVPNSDRDEVSPFAQMAGALFERRVLNDTAALEAAFGPIHDDKHVSAELPGVDPIIRTGDLLDSAPPGTLIHQAHVELTVAGHTHVVKPDLLYRLPDRRWQVGEIKAYLVESGFEDALRLGSAAGQAALGYVALTQAGVDVDDFVVLIRHDRLRRPVSIRALAALWAGHVADFADAAAVLRAEHPEPVDLETLTSIPHTYEPACEQLCDLAPLCRPA